MSPPRLQNRMRNIKIGKNREESETAKLPKQGTPGPGCQTSPKECIKIGKNREESETVSPQRLQNLRNLRNRVQNLRNKPGTPGPGCQTSPKECIEIGKNREESETVSPQRLQNLRNLRNRVQNLRNREPQGQDAKRHLRNALR